MEHAKNDLSRLIHEYYEFIKNANRDEISEETVRMWINELLGIFGWDVRDTGQVQQEISLLDEHIERLVEIDSNHKVPDYKFVNGRNIKTFFDAKSLDVDLRRDKKAAFQIKSYGWSAGVPCAFISNFEQFVVYDCRFTPNKDDPASVGSNYFFIEEYIDRFDELYNLLNRENILNNNLEQLFQIDEIEGTHTLDYNFNLLLSEFRVVLAQNMLEKNSNIITTNQLLNYYTQVILDRIIFIRVCESRGIERESLLKTFVENGFWGNFKSSCYMDFYNHYDGAMFERDSRFQLLDLDDNIFNEFIKKLYYPYPYRFDIMPVRILAKIYEEFLTYGLVFEHNIVQTQIKDDYIRTNGAIPTPEYIVQAICDLTVDLSNINSIEELYELKILDPCCGSGVFLIGCFEMLSEKMKELIINDAAGNYSNFYIQNNEEIYLNVDAKSSLIVNCLFGIDYDEVAIEVTKMSLALKIIDDSSLLTHSEVGLFGQKILKNIDNNILLCNTLIDLDIDVPIETVTQIRAINIFQHPKYKPVFENKGGFDYVVGNPPYVETKHFKRAIPEMHNYLRLKYLSFEGKADLSVLFIERCLDLLNPSGKLGFIVQRRWFKTDYGDGIRNIISENNYMYKLYDIQTSSLFPGRMTYVSIMILNKIGTEITLYKNIPGDPIDVMNYLENNPNEDIEVIPTNYFKRGIWSPESYVLEEIKDNVKDRIGTINDSRIIHVKDGIQALYKKAYHIKQFSIEDGIIRGINGFDMPIEIEIEMVKPVIYNTAFYPFKDLEPSAYCFFPYKGRNYDESILISEIRDEYPRSYNFLLEIEPIIKSKVKFIDDDELWHTFTRVHNHSTYNDPKIIIPMTAKDTIASYESDVGLYMDNANVWFLTVQGENTTTMKAITSIINSTVFSVFAKAGANPQAGGYYKFNKQFLTPVPFPNELVENMDERLVQLANLHDDIKQLQNMYLNSNINIRPIYRAQLEEVWSNLDEICNDLYGLSLDQIDIIQEEGRTMDRVDILMRGDM